MNCVFIFRSFLRTFFGVILFLMMVSGSCFAQDNMTKPFVVVIDAGHGGKDPGTVGKNSFEKDVNLDVALKVGFYLDKFMPDVKVIYTRTIDVFVDLSVRADIANRNHADLFVSIHSNAMANNTTTYGTETYVMGLHKSDANFDLVIKENKVILLEDNYEEVYEGFDPEKPESYIMFQLMQTNNLSQSLNLAGKIQDQFRERAQRKDLGVKQGGLLVLWKTTMPGVLVELGFLSNAREEAFLNTNNGKDIMASAIYRAIKEYKEEIQQRSTDAILAENTQSNVNSFDKQDFSKDDLSVTSVGGKTETQSEFNKTTTSNVEFRVQILASKVQIPLSSKTFKGYRDIDEIVMDGYYKYMSKPVTDYNEALKLREKMGNSFKGAFVVPFRNGNKIPLEEALKNHD